VETDACGHIQCIKENKSVESTHIYSDIPGTFKVTISPVYDERGEVEKSVHFIKDITKEIEYERQLKESLKRAEEISNYLETLIESSPDSIISTDQEGKIVYFSKGASEVLGYEPEEIQGKHVSEVYPSLEDAKKIGRAMRKNNGKIRNYNVSLKRKDGSLVEVLLSASTLFDEEGKSAGTVGISKDLSKIDGRVHTPVGKADRPWKARLGHRSRLQQYSGSYFDAGRTHEDQGKRAGTFEGSGSDRERCTHGSCYGEKTALLLQTRSENIHFAEMEGYVLLEGNIHRARPPPGGEAENHPGERG
jgi:PAS domain S-box-containing protein